MITVNFPSTIFISFRKRSFTTFHFPVPSILLTIICIVYMLLPVATTMFFTLIPLPPSGNKSFSVLILQQFNNFQISSIHNSKFIIKLLLILISFAHSRLQFPISNFNFPFSPQLSSFLLEKDRLRPFIFPSRQSSLQLSVSFICYYR
jgi:hypothetical protein